MKTLVVGGSGFVGRYLVNHFGAVGTSGSGRDGFIKLDITSRPEVRRLLERIRPELVINSAAMTGVDECERKSDLAFTVNAQGVRNVCDAASEVGARFVHISTDYVFDGERGNYGEDDPVNPINQYGRSKLLGETYARERPSLILRISSPFGINLGAGKESFFEYVIRSLSGGGRTTVRAFVDQITTPTFVEEIPRAIEALFRADMTGTFHLAVKGGVSRYDFALQIAELAGFDGGWVVKSLSQEMGFFARRPRDTSLRTDKISEIFEAGTLQSDLKGLIARTGRPAI